MRNDLVRIGAVHQWALMQSVQQSSTLAELSAPEQTLLWRHSFRLEKISGPITILAISGKGSKARQRARVCPHQWRRLSRKQVLWYI